MHYFLLKNMIYLFIGEKYFRQKLIATWKNSFAQKFDENNIIHIHNVFDYEISFFYQNLLSNGLFSTKNLCIIDDFPFSSDENTQAKVSEIQNQFLSLLPHINTENILVFNNEKIDKRSKIYKELLKYAEVKDFTIDSPEQLQEKLQEIYKEKISIPVIKKLIELKWLHFSQIVWEIDKILITQWEVTLESMNHISKDVEENIFDILNDILNNQFPQWLKKLQELSDTLDNPYFLYNSFASNLRTSAYILKLQSLKKSSSDIKQMLDLWNKGFLATKTYKISSAKCITLYQNIAKIDAKMKTGNMLGSEKDDMLYELQKALFI